VCQVKHDLMMLWVPPVWRRWKARKAKQRGISKVARGLFPEKGGRIEGIWVHESSRLVSDLQIRGLPAHSPVYSTGATEGTKKPDRAMKRPAWFLVIGYG
jgi:hypothetical protein